MRNIYDGVAMYEGGIPQFYGANVSFAVTFVLLLDIKETTRFT